MQSVIGRGRGKREKRERRRGEKKARERRGDFFPSTSLFSRTLYLHIASQEVVDSINSYNEIETQDVGKLF
jgi:transposase